MLVFGFLCWSVFSILVAGQNAGNRPRAMSHRSRGRPRQMHRNVNNAQNEQLQQLQQQQQQQQEQQQIELQEVTPRRPMGGRNGEQQPFIPQDWRDLVQRNGGVHDVMDFINLLETPEGRQVVEDDIFSNYETPDGKRVITGGGIMATSDECSPRNMSVRLPLDFRDSQVAYYPECTMVQRCGGCTPTPFLSCEPLYKEKIVLKVLRARYLYPGAMSMRWEGFSSVEVERHLSCRAVCNLEPNDCNDFQRFNPYQCKCICMRYLPCFNEKVWDSERCGCRCRNEGPCCADPGQEDDRTCTSYFDNDFCECTLKTAIGFSPNASRAEIDAWQELRRANQGNEGNNNGGGGGGVQEVTTEEPTTPTTTATTTTTTTTTTTPGPSTPPGCNSRRCPINFRLIVTPSGRCVCVYSGRRRPRRMRGRRSVDEEAGQA